MAASIASGSLSTQELRLSAEEIQQQYYEARGEEDWELYEKKDRKHLLQKVGIALYGPPRTEGNLMPTLDGSDEVELKLQGFVREEGSCLKVFNKICEQAKYSHNDKNVLISILRIVLVTPKQNVGIFEKTPDDYWLNLHTKRGDEVSIFVFHVFCIRKCVPMKSDVKGCRSYIDHDGRVYKTWQNYLEDNVLPKGIMVVPENGEYRGGMSVQEITSDEDMDSYQAPKVKLTVLTSPAMGLGARILNVTDVASIAANIGALGATIGAAFAAPVVAPFLIGGAIVTGVATGIYAIVRSSMRLADRGKHEQNIGLDSVDARNDWINILVSTLGISFSAAAKLVAWAAMSGTNIKVLMNALTFLRYSSIASGVVGVVNSLGDMIHNYKKYDETPSALEIFQFTTSCLFLGIGVMSNATAQEIVQDAQATAINEARDTLSSNAKRKAFDKVTAENRRTLGTINGNAETIKALQVITDKDDFFAKIARMNKDMNRNKVRVSITSDGKTLINSKYEVSVKKLYGMGKGGRNKLFSKLGPADTSTKNAPTRIYASTCSAGSTNLIGKNIALDIGTQDVLAITQFCLSLCKADQDFVAEVLSNLSAELHNAFLLICIRIVSTVTPGHHIAARVVHFVYNYIRSKVSEHDYDNDHAILLILKSWIKNGVVDKQIIQMLIQKFKEFEKREGVAFHDDPDNYDYLQEFRNRMKSHKTLRSGDVMSIGMHKIVVKGNTLDAIEEWLDCTQDDADLLMEFIYKVIQFLSPKEVHSINLINPDEDIIMRVAYYLFNEVAIEVLLLELKELGIVPKRVINFKSDLIDWRNQQTLKAHKVCETCEGLLYNF